MNKKRIIKIAATGAAIGTGLLILSSLRSVIDLGRWIEESEKEYRRF